MAFHGKSRESRETTKFSILSPPCSLVRILNGWRIIGSYSHAYSCRSYCAGEAAAAARGLYDT